MGDLLDCQIVPGLDELSLARPWWVVRRRGAKIRLLHIDNGKEAYVGRNAGVCTSGIGLVVLVDIDSALRCTQEHSLKV